MSPHFNKYVILLNCACAIFTDYDFNYVNGLGIFFIILRKASIGFKN